MQRHPRDVRRDPGDFDAVVFLADALRGAGNVGPAAPTRRCEHLALRGGVGVQRPMRARHAAWPSPSRADPDGFCPFEGGTLELSGVFGGSPSVASSSAIRAVSCAFCLACARINWISAGLSSESSSSGVIPSLNQPRSLASTLVNYGANRGGEQLQCDPNDQRSVGCAGNSIANRLTNSSRWLACRKILRNHLAAPGQKFALSCHRAHNAKRLVAWVEFQVIDLGPNSSSETKGGANVNRLGCSPGDRSS